MCIPQDRLQVHGLTVHNLYGFYKLMAHDGFFIKKKLPQAYFTTFLPAATQPWYPLSSSTTL